MTTLIIIRHGNTFEKGETPRRVGARTDLPLTEAGKEQARAIGRWLKENGLYPEAVYSSQLQRTHQTATIALKEAGYIEPVYQLEIFNEVDYGPDENVTDDVMIARIGEQALKDWEEKSIVPEGWNFNPEKTIKDWQDFASHIVADNQDCIMVATSNGIARFAPYITGDYPGFIQEHSPKISTGAICVFTHEKGQWTIREWNLKPLS
jgi:2,3-bisphosphoglycerate-dependent phosphoglycerate mutase